ncbi:MAG TPA: beta-L-arabinofuranosidase domain-containing protein [Tepidisphaeraceae bacterium]|nr:beta-L-arabinofuranosidase domain-containing protein [Tepidisphaeraceae bacterium]
MYRVHLFIAVAMISTSYVSMAKAADANIALAAKASASFVSEQESIDAINDGFEPRNARDHNHGAYGNWPKSGTQWVQYEWNQPISTSKIDVYWWVDGRSIHLPKSCRLTYWNGNAFVPVEDASGLGVVGGQYNTTTFGEIKTSKMRLEFDADGNNSTGIIEWKVYDSGQSPKFPPRVTAGPDRVVMVGAKTYLNGSVKAIQPSEPTSLSWTRESGPGEVAFLKADSPVTSATFSAPGEYALKLTATEGQMSSASTLRVKVETAAPVQQLQAVYTKNYTITSSLWKDRAKALIVSWIPHCIEECSKLDLAEGGINNFIQAGNKLAGKEYTKHAGYPFSNAWVHNTVESMCVALMVDPQGDQQIIDAQNMMRAKLDEWIPIILAAQEPDGYLQTRFTLGTARDRGPVNHWDPRTRGEHEGYVSGYFIESAIAHHLATNGKDLRLYNAAKKLADCWYDNIGPTPQKAWYDGHQEMEQALVRLGRFVNDVEGAGKGQKYIELARFLFDSRQGGSEYDQSHLPIVQQYEAVGHAVRAAYTYSGMADVAVETHDLDYHGAVNSLWDNIVNRKYYVTGGIGSGETPEGFGPNYSLRNNSYCESCSNCGELFFQWKMLLAYHDSKYASLYEDTLYNAILGDISLDGKTFYYTNELAGGFGRYLWHDCPCCVGNISRVLLMLPTWMYARSDDSIYVNLFIGSKVNVENVAGTNVEMVQTTEYPYNDKVSITVNPATSKNFTVKVRLPDRDVSELYTSTPSADGITSISVNGTAVMPTIDRGYAVITRNWTAGDKIDLVLPLKVQRIKASDKVAADAGRVALRYGPLIYNIESQDQNVDGVLKADAPLTTEWQGDFLHGVMVIKGAFADGNPMLAIPNYARNNRVPTTARPGNRDDRDRSIVWILDQ